MSPSSFSGTERTNPNAVRYHEPLQSGAIATNLAVTNTVAPGTSQGSYISGILSGLGANPNNQNSIVLLRAIGQAEGPTGVLNTTQKEDRKSVV